MATGTRPAAFLDEPDAIDGSGSLRALLADYAALLDRVEGAGAVQWARPFRWRPLRWVLIPAPRAVVRVLLVRHVSRRVEALRRRSCSREAVDGGSAGPSRELTRLEYFERSLPAALRPWLLWPLGLLTLLLISYVFANHIAQATSAADLLGDLTTAAVELDRSAAIDAFDRNKMEARYFIGAAMFLAWSAVILIAPLLPAFSVLRRLRREREDLEQHEARAFAELGARRVDDLQLDLVTRLLLVAAQWAFGVAALLVPLTETEETETVASLIIGAFIVSVTSIAGIGLLRRYGRRRRHDAPRRARITGAALWLVWTMYAIGILLALTA